jgi:hypothetical protein
MVETMNPEHTIHDDLVAAFAELPDIVADETADTGTYRYKYATLASIVKAVKPVLAKHHLALTQPVTTADDQLVVVTTLVHVSGNTHSSGAWRSKLPPTPQAQGSLVSYVRRYQLVALLGLAVDDDDGKSAQTAARPAGGTRGAAERALTEPQRRRIMAMFGELGMSGPEYRDERLSLTAEIIGRDIETTNEVTRDEAAMLIDDLSARIDRLETGSYG